MKIRSFIAVNLPLETKKELKKGVEKIKKEIKTGVKWVEAENFHLTLHFLGELEVEEIQKVKDILRKTVVLKEIKLKIGQTGCFPHRNSPQIMFFKCYEVESNYLTEFQERIGNELKKSGFEVDERPWQMHLTFGRVKTPIKIPDSLNKKMETKEFLIKSIDLMKSELQPSGPVYTILKQYPII